MFSLNDPTTYEEILSRPDKDLWLKAMTEEYQSLMDNNTWDLCDLPKDRKPIKNKWVFKTKKDENGQIVKYKARLVIKGCSQKFGVDYEEIFSPVVRYSSIRYLMALSVKYNLDIDQMDAVSAFLQGELNDKIIFMSQPLGFHDKTQKVCRLNRALYGLKQSSRVWNQKLDAALKKFGLTQSNHDPCVYNLFKESNILIVAIYVDDFVIFSNNMEMKTNFKKYLNQTFKMKDLGAAQNCLGIKIDRDRNRGVLYLSQKKYIQDILEKFNMKDCKPISTPMDINVKFDKSQGLPSEEEKSYMQNIPYREAVGCLMYLAQITRPDIYHVVHKLSQFNCNPTKDHWIAVKRVMRYLKGSINYKLTYTKDANDKIIGYCDADWAGCTDTRHSTSGYVFIMQGGPISWSSKKQTCVALSSCEAEYISLSHATQEALWWDLFQKEIDGETGIKMLVDNQSAICLASEQFYHPRTKHIDIKYHFVREAILKEIIAVSYISTQYQAADMFTKVLNLVKLNNNCKMIGMTN